MTTTATAHRLTAAAAAASALLLALPAAAYAAAPQAEDLSEDTYGGVSLGEGVGAFPNDSTFELMLASEDFEIPESVEVWALPPDDGDPVLIGSGETTSDVYQNPGSPTYPEQEVELIEVNFPSSEVATSDWYAFAAVDEATGELITWTSYPVVREGDSADFSGSPRDNWPVPDHSENTEPSSDPPTLETLTEDTYGVVSILRDEPVIPLDEAFTVDVETSSADVDLWLLPPGGEDAIFLPAEMVSDGVGVSAENPRWSTTVDSEMVDYSGIYGIVATNESDGLIGWTPFALHVDDQPLQPGDPGVHQSEAGYSDRSIWPIPDSVPEPEEGQTAGEEEPEEETADPSPTPTGEETGTELADQPEATASPDTASVTGGVDGWVIVLAFTGAGLIIAGVAYLIALRRR